MANIRSLSDLNKDTPPPGGPPGGNPAIHSVFFGETLIANSRDSIIGSLECPRALLNPPCVVCPHLFIAEHLRGCTHAHLLQVVYLRLVPEEMHPFQPAVATSKRFNQKRSFMVWCEAPVQNWSWLISVRLGTSDKRLPDWSLSKFWLRCGPCRMVAPHFAALSEQYPQVVFVKVDIDRLRNFSSQAGVSRVPTFQFFQSSKVADLTML